MSSADVETMPVEGEAAATSASSSSEPPRFEIKSKYIDFVVLYLGPNSMRGGYM